VSVDVPGQEPAGGAVDKTLAVRVVGDRCNQKRSGRRQRQSHGDADQCAVFEMEVQDVRLKPPNQGPQAEGAEWIARDADGLVRHTHGREAFRNTW